MKKTLILINIFFSCFLFYACEQNIPLEIEEFQQNLITVQGVLINDQAPKIHLTTSNPLVGSVPYSYNEDPLDKFITDATVILKSDDFTDTLQVQTDYEYYPNTEVIHEADTLFYPFRDSIPISYSYSNQRLIENNRNYYLEIYHNDQYLSAQTYVPESIPVDTVFLKVVNSEGEFINPRFKIGLTDPPGQGDYYYFDFLYNIEFNGGIITGGDFFELDSLSLSNEYNYAIWDRMKSDEGRDGTSFKLTFFPYNIPIYQDSLDVYVYLRRAHQDFGEYVQSIEDQLNFGDASQSPFVEPPRINSNIEGGQGIFAGVARSKEPYIYRIDIE